MTTATLVRPLGPFDLAASQRFACAAAQLCVGGTRGHIHLAFVPDGEPLSPAGACIRPVDDAVAIELYGDVADEGRAIDQVVRILSLDIDAAAWPSVGERDPVIGRLLRERPGFRPVNFVSPYECACWLLLTHRTSIAQATAVREAIAADLGASVDIHGDVRRAFPGPAALHELGEVGGLSAVKRARLRAVAEAALRSDLLDGVRLRSIAAEDAVDQLITALPGVGQFTAQGIVLRGAGAPDVLALAEPRLAACVQRWYGDADLGALAETWRPFRSWAQVLLRSAA